MKPREWWQLFSKSDRFEEFAMKDDVREVRQGFEFGVGLSDFDAFETGDVLECMVNEQIP